MQAMVRTETECRAATGSTKDDGGAMRTRNAGGIVVLAVLSIGCAEDTNIRQQEMSVGPDLVVSRIRARGPVGEEPELEFHRAQDMDFVGDSIVVADNGNDRMVLLDASMRFVWSSGREGEGPGEFESPFAVRGSERGVTAVDIGNGRFTWLDRSGAVVRTLTAPHTTSTFGVRADGAVVMPARLETHYAYIVGQEDSAVPFLPRDTTLGLEDPFGDRARPPLIAITRGDTIHVFDELDFHLYKYDTDGNLVLRRGIPTGFRDSVYAESKALVNALTRSGYRVVGSTLARTFKSTPDGRLVLLARSGLTIGYVIDSGTYDAQRIVVPEDITEWSPLKNASSVALTGNRLIALSEDSLFVYELREAGS
jgi:hypothetical protein